jgi:phosphatidylserine/phosphatidylglycerophosphate/cardiolipin synthase-like enzyme
MKLLVQPGAGLVPLIDAIRRAKKTVDIAVFRLNRKEIEIALAQAVQRGVKVRALIAHTNRGGEDRLRKLEERLLASGVTVSRTGDEFVKYHGKYLLVDNSLHVFGFNYTKADLSKRRSFGVQTRHRRAVSDAVRLFECDVGRQPYDGSTTSPLVVSPETSRAVLARFVGGARKRLSIYDARLEDPSFIKLLRQRAEAGVQVQVIGKAARIAPAEVRALKELRIHVRAIIRDGTQAFVGSQSLRKLELDRRREVGVIIRNPSIARQMLEVFETDWSASAPVDEKKGEEKKDERKDETKEEKKDEKKAADKADKKNGKDKKDDKKDSSTELAGARA